MILDRTGWRVQSPGQTKQERALLKLSPTSSHLQRPLLFLCPFLQINYSLLMCERPSRRVFACAELFTGLVSMSTTLVLGESV